MNLEDKLQASCVKWFRLQHPHLTMFAIPNGGQRTAVTGALMKKTGTLAGVADLFLMYGIFPYNGLFIEMKVGKNKQTESQVKFQQKAEQAFFKYEICRSLDEFKEVIEKYLTQ